MNQNTSNSKTNSKNQHTKFLLNPGKQLDWKNDQQVIKELTESLIKLQDRMFSDRNDSNNARPSLFIGAQVLGLDLQNLERVKNHQEFLVCQKSDGVRYIMLIRINRDGKFETYLTSRKTGKSEQIYQYFKIEINLPDIQIDAKQKDTEFGYFQIFDGELVFDYNVVKKTHQPKYLIFDCLISNFQPVHLDCYKDRVKNALNFTRYVKGMIDIFGRQESTTDSDDSGIDEEIQDDQRISIVVQDFFQVEQLSYILDSYIPSVPHGNDGLIFTHQTQQYYSGTHNGMIKWKPPSLLTIDFVIIPSKQRVDKRLEKLYGIGQLYVMNQDRSLRNEYSLIFFDYIILDQEEYNKFEAIMDQDESATIVVQCKFSQFQQKTLQDKKFLLEQLLPVQKVDQNYVQQVIQQLTGLGSQFIEGEEGKDNLAKEVQIFEKNVQNYSKCFHKKGWSVEKTRLDKSEGNSLWVAQNVMISVHMNLDKDQLIQKILQPR